MSQKRVAVVLAALVGTMTISAGVLLLMDPGSLSGSNIPTAAAVNPSSYPASTRAIAQLHASTPLQTKGWNYIIIYESADVSASANTLADGRMTGGSDSPSKSVRPKANFHFVIDSALSGDAALDGSLEVGTTWKMQEPGAPYAGWPDHRSHMFTPYTNAVGICLAADLNHRPLSEAQHQSLLQVVRDLQQKFNIPHERVLFQWDNRLNVRQPTSGQKAYEQTFHAQLDQPA